MPENVDVEPSTCVNVVPQQIDYQVNDCRNSKQRVVHRKRKEYWPFGEYRGYSLGALVSFLV